VVGLVTESKELIKEEHIKALVKSAQEPPQLSDENKSLHISNCMITLANLCTFKFDQNYSGADLATRADLGCLQYTSIDIEFYYRCCEEVPIDNTAIRSYSGGN